MSNHSNGLIAYYDALDEAFPPSEMSEIARSAAAHDFRQYVRQEDLSLEAATAVLRDEKKVAGFREIGRKVETYIMANGHSPAPDKEQTATELVNAFLDDLKTVRLTVDRIATIGSATNEILTQVEKQAAETGAEATNNKKLLHEIRDVAGELKHDIANAITSTQDIVPRLETISSHLDGQLQKLDKGVDEVRDNTHPKKTRKENVKMMLHSVAWGRAFTPCGYYPGIHERCCARSRFVC